MRRALNGAFQSGLSAHFNSKMYIKTEIFPLHNVPIKPCVSVGVYERLVKCNGLTGQAGWCHSSDLLLHY